MNPQTKQHIISRFTQLFDRTFEEQAGPRGFKVITENLGEDGTQRTLRFNAFKGEFPTTFLAELQSDEELSIVSTVYRGWTTEGQTNTGVASLGVTFSI